MKKVKGQEFTTLTMSAGLVVGEPEDPSDRWTSYSDAHYEWALEEVCLQKPESGATYYWDCLEVLDCEDVSEYETIFVVVVRYSTGDTFSHSTGKGALAGAFIYWDNAEELAKKIVAGEDRHEDCCGYACRAWGGYFESVEDCYVQEVPLKEKSLARKSFMGSIFT